MPLFKTLPNGTTISDIDDKLLSYLTGTYHPSFTDEDANKVVYISVERSTNHHSCGVQLRRANHTSAEQCLFAFALLDYKLQPIPGAEVVVDLDHYILWRHINITKKESDICFFNDVTMFAARSTKNNPKKDQLFLMSSNVQDGTAIFPIDIRRTPHFTEDDEGWDTKLVGSPLPKEMYEDGTLYGEGLQLRLVEEGKNKAYVRGRFHRFIDTFGGYVDYEKNYHAFEASDGVIWLETNPVFPHSTSMTNFFFEKGLSRLDQINFFPNTTLSRKTRFLRRQTNKNRGAAVRFEMYRKPERTSFSTISAKEIVQPYKRDFRGTACCIDLHIDADGKQNTLVKVGLGHSVTWKGRAYLSFFYAFLPYPPFHVVAYSGYFCLGGMKVSDNGVADHWMSQQIGVFNQTMSVLNQTYNCPVITFASSMVPLVGDDGKVIVSYGVNDCYSRSIVIPKEKIRMLLEGAAPSSK